MSLVAPSNGETITVYRQTRDNFGDQTPGDSHEIDQCAIWSTNTSETVTGEDMVIWALTVLCPANSDVLSSDRVSARGTTYDVLGEPILHRSSITGHASGLEVHLTTATG